MRVAVLVSGEGSNLQALLDDPAIDVVAVAASSPSARALGRASAAGVDTEVFEASSRDDRPERDAALAGWLEERGVELVVLAGFMEVLTADFVRRFAGRLINVHPSLLPAFPGVRAVEQAIEYGVRVMGVTVHFVDEGVDSGPIIAQRCFDAVPYARDIEALRTRIHAIEHDLLPAVVRLIGAGAVRIDGEDPRRVIVAEEQRGGD